MPYSINIRSDDESSSKIRSLWALCSGLEETPSMESLAYPPHFTLAVLDVAQEAELVSVIESLPADLSRITVRFDRIRHFETPHSIVLWAAPADAESLTELHRRVHSRIDSESCRPNYRVGNWVPHCSLAFAIDPARRSEALAIVETEIAPFDVVFDVIDCAHFHPVEVLYERALPVSSEPWRYSADTEP